MSMKASREQSPISQPQPSTLNRVGAFYRRHPTLIGTALGSAGTLGYMKYKKPIGKFLENFGDYMKRAGTNAYRAIVNTPYRNPNSTNYDKEHKNTVNNKND